MKIFLDTTYFIPAIGIGIKDIPWDVAFRISEKAETNISNLTYLRYQQKERNTSKAE